MQNYRYTHSVTEGTTGYFSCEPEPAPALEEALRLLSLAPMDEFLHRYALKLCMRHRLEELEALAPAVPEEAPVISALLLECALLDPRLAPLAGRFGPDAALRFCGHSPLIHLRASLVEHCGLRRAWNTLFSANRDELRALPHPEDADLALPYGEEEPVGFAGPTLAALTADAPPPAPVPRPPAGEIAALALERLEAAELLAGPEMRHEASLSPIALQRAWKLSMRVKNGALDFELRGTATSYGRGLSLAGARASCLMEIVERVSTYFSVNGDEIPGRRHPLRLVRARFSELERRGEEAAHPDALLPDVPYGDEILHWLPAKAARDGRRVLVPAQIAGLFCNLDEPALFAAPGSTGLASGGTLDEAKESALTEILERDALAVTPYRRDRCFCLKATEEPLAGLLADYAARDIQIRFQELESEFGLPVYACFVVSRQGKIVQSCGAGLSGRRALLSALTETPYPYPNGPASGPGLRGLPERAFESLPDYDRGGAAANRALLEKLLLGRGLEPLYVELTRADLDFPVLRAIVPGLETGAADPVSSRLSRRLFARYMKS